MVHLWDAAYKDYWRSGDRVNIFIFGGQSDDFIDPLKENGVEIDKSVIGNVGDDVNKLLFDFGTTELVKKLKRN